MKVVVDAGVALKWFFRESDDEDDVAPALALLRGVLEDRVSLVQPPHFVAEVSAVLARQSASPAAARAGLRDLLDIEMEFVDSEAIYARAMALAARYGHHVFDTLYHAVALETDGAMLVTADIRYARKAGNEGRMTRLAGFVLT